MIKLQYAALSGALLLLLQGCKKDFLDERPNKALLVPSTLADFRALLDNTGVFNISPGLTFVADGDFYTNDAGFSAWSQDMERNSYTWAKTIFTNAVNGDWSVPYKQVFYANVVLEGMAGVDEGSAASAEGRAIRGTALFDRAFAFYNLAIQFAPPYQAASAAGDIGIPLRLHSDVTQKVPRATVRDTYAQILADLDAARALLPVSVTYKNRPAVAAVWALRSRVALAMGDYPAAGKYADSVLSADAALLDYNTLNMAASRPFPRPLPFDNAEVVYYSVMVSYSFNTTPEQTFADSILYRAYAANDLRKGLFFSLFSAGNYKFKGNYGGTLLIFSGLARDELYLTRAEARARAGDAAGAMADLNVLLSKRWVNGTFVPYTASDADDALRQVLSERRKELIGRNLRWADLRRLNTDGRFQVTLNRAVKGGNYTLTPGSKRYTYPLPDEEITLGGLVQNER